MLWIAPGGAAQFDNLGGGFRECGNRWLRVTNSFPLVPFLGDRVPAFGNGGAIILGNGPSFGKADGGIGPKTYVPATAMYYNPLDP